MGITFYYAPRTSSTRVHWALDELALAYEAVRVDLAAGEQRTASFLAINPNGKVAALVDDGASMFESLAILIHLGEKYGVAKGLWPAPGSAQSAEALSWTVWSAVTLGGHGLDVLSNTSERVAPELRNEARAEQAKTELAADLAILETKLEGRTYLLGDTFTLADIAVAGAASFFSRISGADRDAFPRVAAWTARCLGRPAMKALQSAS